MSKLSSSKFCHSTQCSADAWIVALLWKLPQMQSCSANNANLDKNNVDMFYKIDCCATIHGQIWMNNVPNESRIILLSCTEISFVKYIYIFFFFFLVKPGFPIFFLTHTVYRDDWRSKFYCASPFFNQKCVVVQFFLLQNVININWIINMNKLINLYVKSFK